MRSYNTSFKYVVIAVDLEKMSLSHSSVSSHSDSTVLPMSYHIEAVWHFLKSKNSFSLQ